MTRSSILDAWGLNDITPDDYPDGQRLYKPEYGDYPSIDLLDGYSDENWLLELRAYTLKIGRIIRSREIDNLLKNKDIDGI